MVLIRFTSDGVRGFKRRSDLSFLSISVTHSLACSLSCLLPFLLLHLEPRCVSTFNRNHETTMGLFDKDFFRSVAGEFLVTFIFLSTVFSMLVNSSRALDPIVAGEFIPGIVVAFVATAIIYAFADVSGAHFNPAVTTGFIVTGKIHIIKGACYIAVQILAAVSAAALMYAIFPNHVDGLPTIAQVIPAGVPDTTPLWQAVIMEMFLTFLLVYIIFATAVDQPAPPTFTKVPLEGEAEPAASAAASASASAEGDLETGSKSATNASASKERIQVFTTSGTTKNNFAPIAIGLTLGFLCYLGGSSSGGAFNPARVLGPAIVTGNFNSHWVYWVGDLSGGALAAALQTFIFSRANGCLAPSLAV